MYFHLCYYHICEQVWLIHWLLLCVCVWQVCPWQCVMNLCTQVCQGLMELWAAWLLEDSLSSACGRTSLLSPVVTQTHRHTGAVIICCLKYLMAVKWRCSYITNDVRWHLSTNLFWGMLFSSHCVYSNMHNSFRLRKSALPNKYLGYQECGVKSDKWNMWSYLLWWRLLNKRTA